MKKATSTKKAVNVSIDGKLVILARQSDINMSAVLEKALREEVARRWRSDNAEAFEENRKRVEAEGLWCDDLRLW